MSEKKIAQAIIRYLLKHPDAGDTIEGIATWWIAIERVETGIEEVRSAVNGLVSKGILIPREIRNGPQVYFVNRERISDLRDDSRRLDE